MLLKNIEFYNFGRYAGKHLFDTSVTTDRNVILIKAKNDRGKTTLFQAIKFALYGDDGLRPKSSNEWINFQIASQDDGEMYVELNFEDEGENYKIRRVLKFRKTERGQEINTVGNPIIELFQNDNPHMSTDSGLNKQAWIDTILPKDASQFFFFDGEEIQKYIKNEETHVKQAIQKVLGIKELLNAKEDLLEILPRFVKECSDNMKKNLKSENDKKELEELERAFQEIHDEIEFTKNSLQSAETRKNALEKKQIACTAISEMAEDRRQVKQELENQRKILDSTTKELADKRANLGLILLSPLLKILYEAEEDPPTKDRLQSDAANFIIESLDVCVCGNHIDQKMREILKSKILDLEPTKTSMIKSLVNQMLMIHNPDGKHVELINGLENISDISQSIDKHKSTLVHLNKQINDNSGVDDMKYIQRDYEEVVKDIGTYETDLKAFDGKQSQLDIDKKKIESHIKSSIVDTELTLSIQKREACKKVLKCIDACIEKFYKNRKPELEKYISQIFISLTNNPDMYKELKITNDFSMRVVRNDGTELPTHRYSPSAGASQIVATSMIGGLNKFATRDAPVIIDTPMGRLDPEHRHNLIKYYSKMSKQIIIMYQPSELNDKDIQNINDHLASEWVIKSKSDQPNLSYISREETYL